MTQGLAHYLAEVARYLAPHPLGAAAGAPNGLAVRTANAVWGGHLPPWVPFPWRAAVAALRRHAERGARRVREAEADPAVVALVRWHEAEEPPAELARGLRPLLDLLQAADEEN